VSLSWRRRRDPGPWRAGNRVTLLENGEQFFPRAFAAIAGAQREIIVETFILFEDRVGATCNARSSRRPTVACGWRSRSTVTVRPSSPRPSSPR
jgi:phosphatidylserine/phosphatidylglycerophosphate/cardiolipin synthase-like enzyme